jgi:hypothetical protein
MSTSMLPVACSLGERELAERGQALGRDLFAHAERVEELPDGFAWRFAGDGDWHAKLIEFAASERRCCSFFRIELAFEPGLGPVWLRLTGPAGAKEFAHVSFAVPARP